MRDVSTQLVGLLILIVPVLAIRWNLAGIPTRRSRILMPKSGDSRWRLEIYSIDDDLAVALADPADVPFPVKRVRSAKADVASVDPELAWTLPRVELDVEVVDPYAESALNGLLGTDHRVRFITGNEAVVDHRSTRLRIRAFRFG